MLSPHLKEHRFLSNQSSEFGFVIVDVEIILNASNDRMLARNRDISDSYLAFMTPPNLYAILRSVLHHHYTLFLFAGTLQDDILTRGLLHSNRLFNILITISSNNFNVPRELALAHLAFELGKIVVLCSSHNFFLHLYPNPLG